MQEEALRSRSEEQPPVALPYLTRALGDLPSCVLVIGARGKIVFANEAACDTMDVGDYVGKSFAEYFMVFPNSVNDPFYEAILDTIRDKSVRRQGRFVYVSPNGKRSMLYLTSSFLGDPGDESYLVITCTDVSAEEEIAHLRLESNFLLISTIVYVCTYLIVYAVWEHFGQPFDRAFFVDILEVGGLFFAFLALRFTSLRFVDFGLGASQLGRNLKEGACISLGVAVCLIALKLVLLRLAPQLLVHSEALCSLAWVRMRDVPSFAFTALTQVFLTQGVMHQSLRYVLSDRGGRAVATLVPALLFASLFMPFGLPGMLEVAVVVALLGVVYERHGSIWGLVLVQFTLLMGSRLLGLV